MPDRTTSENESLAVAIDKVRASRDGHSYHEIWAARVALELLHPSNSLRILTVEGFSTEDEPSVSDSATEIADLVRYRNGIDINTASSIEVLQLKYSVARADQGVRAFDVRTDALLGAAIKAVRLDMTNEARSIIDAIGLHRPSGGRSRVY
jgi:hypothetical protein